MPQDSKRVVGKWLLVACVLLLPGRVWAWGACLPFCDFMCAVPATVEWGASGAAAYGEEMAAVVELGGAIASATAAVGSLNVAVVSQTFVSEQQLLNGIDASTKIMQGEYTKSNLLAQRLTDMETAAYKQLFTDVTLFEQTQTNMREISNREAASPSGEVAGKTAGDLNNAIRVVQEILAKEPENQKMAMEDMDKSKIATFFIQVMRFIKAAVPGSDGAGGAAANTSQEYNTLRDHLMVVYTQTLKNIHLKARDSDIEQKVAVSKAGVKYMAGIESAAVRYAYASQPVVAGEAQRSLLGLLQDKVSYRVNDPNWYQAVKLANEFGLRRELVAMKAEENLMLYEIYKAKESQNTYRALRMTMNGQE